MYVCPAGEVKFFNQKHPLRVFFQFSMFLTSFDLRLEKPEANLISSAVQKPEYRSRKQQGQRVGQVAKKGKWQFCFSSKCFHVICNIGSMYPCIPWANDITEVEDCTATLPLKFRFSDVSHKDLARPIPYHYSNCETTGMLQKISKCCQVLEKSLLYSTVQADGESYNTNS